MALHKILGSYIFGVFGTGRETLDSCNSHRGRSFLKKVHERLACMKPWLLSMAISARYSGAGRTLFPCGVIISRRAKKVGKESSC